jgi:hypothetical protein
MLSTIARIEIPDMGSALNQAEGNVVAQFEVTNHYELPSRGAFVIGHIIQGSVRVGMLAATRLSPPTLTISGMEFLNAVSEHKFWNALIFSEQPNLDFLQRAFPIGCVRPLTYEHAS